MDMRLDDFLGQMLIADAMEYADQGYHLVINDGEVKDIVKED